MSKRKKGQDGINEKLFFAFLEYSREPLQSVPSSQAVANQCQATNPIQTAIM